MNFEGVDKHNSIFLSQYQWSQATDGPHRSAAAIDTLIDEARGTEGDHIFPGSPLQLPIAEIALSWPAPAVVGAPQGADVWPIRRDDTTRTGKPLTTRPSPTTLPSTPS